MADIAGNLRKKLAEKGYGADQPQAIGDFDYLSPVRNQVSERSTLDKALSGATEYGLRTVALPALAAGDVVNKGINAIAGVTNDVVGKATGYRFPSGNLDTGMTNRNLAQMNQIQSDALGAIGMQPVGVAPIAGPKTNPMPARTPSIAGIQPLPNENELRQQFINTEKATPIAPDPNGYASVGGKKINYRDIGSSVDPIAGTAGLSVMPMVDQRAEQKARIAELTNVVDVPMYGEGGRIIGYKTETATPQNSINGQSIAAIAGAPGSPRYGENMKTVLATQEMQRKGIADVALEQQRAATDAEYKKAHGNFYNAEADKARFAMTPEAQAAAGRKEQDKEYAKRVDWHLNNIKDLRLPVGFENKHAEIAKDLAAADDPNKDVGIYYAPGQAGRMGIVTKKTVFDGLLNRYRQQGYSVLDAYSRSVGDLQTIGNQRKQRLYRDIPNFEALYQRDKKSTDMTGA